MTPRHIPGKLYYSISEVSEITGVESYVLRFWETEFPTLRPRKNKKGHRTYRKKDIEHILKIKGLLYDEKYTIPGAREVLSGKKPTATTRHAVAAAAPPPSTPTVSRVDDALLGDVHRELTDILALLDKEKTEDIFSD